MSVRAGANMGAISFKNWAETRSLALLGFKLSSSADGTCLLTDKEAILKRWAEHFDGSIISHHLSIKNDETIKRLPHVECNPLLDEFQTISETVKAIKLLSSGKAPGSDAIPAEIYKAGGPPVTKKLTEIFHIMWRKEAIPQEFKDATITHLFKKKGNPQVCDKSSWHLFIVSGWKDPCSRSGTLT